MAVNQITAQFRNQYNDEFKYDYDREPSLLQVPNSLFFQRMVRVRISAPE